MAKKYNYKQYLLRLNPQDPEDAALIARIEAARREWGGVQRIMKAALLHYRGTKQPQESLAPAAQPVPPPAALLEDLARVVPNLAPAAAQAMADSPPLRPMRALYAALEAFTPDALTEIDALLLQAISERIRGVLDQAADQRQPIRLALQKKQERSNRP